MKKLTRVKLINWHRFNNTTVDFLGITLLSGENGAGKSTLLDAIQFVVTCSANHFNKAAHENGKRKLTGYVRCKTGKENNPYERTGEISSHVALEFYEESKDRYFIVGAVIDSSSEGQEKTVRYMMNDVRLHDDMFFEGRVPYSINHFRSANNKKIKQWCTTEKDARALIKNRFGRIEDKFFRLIPKALAFRPIDDIKDFVYSYVLDAKEVNIDVLRENVRSYQDLQRTLENVKVRIDILDEIYRLHNQVLDAQQKDKMYEYYLERVQADIQEENLRGLRNRLRSEELRFAEQNKRLETLEHDQKDKRVMRDALYTELASDRDFVARDEQKKNLALLEERKQDKLVERVNLMDSVQEAKSYTKKLLEQLQSEGEYEIDSGCIETLKVYCESLSVIEEYESFTEFKDNLQQVIECKNSLSVNMHKLGAELSVENSQNNKLLHETRALIENLERKRLSYPPAVNRVMEAIKEEFLQIDRKPMPRVLCEMLEITDESWRNAVEGYLNTQRFYILVEPENFDIALGVYDNLRKEKRAYGVGLINTQKLDEYEEAPTGSLATVVTSQNKYAKQYINMILGKVVMCDSYADLKKHKTSITKECMKYQNHVANAIKPEIFETPYIGRNAVKVQLEQARQKQQQLVEIEKNIKKRIEGVNRIISCLTTEYDTDIKYRIDVLLELRIIQSEIEGCIKNIKTLEQNSNLIQKNLQLEALEHILFELSDGIKNVNQAIGQLEQRIDNVKQDIERCTSEHAVQMSVYLELAANAGESINIWNKDYESQLQNKVLEQFRDNYIRTRKGNQTRIENLIENMRSKMVEYKTKHDFGAAATMEGYDDFEAEFTKLKNSELLKYEEKVEYARQAAEEEFREQFLAKLQENMKSAQSEFDALNKALKGIPFGNEHYKFLYMPSKKYRHYYDMIMDDFNAMQGESIFSGLFHENHKDVIEELFERLALEQDNSAKALDEFTDYRTYMDYDIKITHSDGNYSFYSKVCEEKSGGETQTPFYVTVAASFVQLYKNNIGGEAVGLVMFDEAFNNMDDERIGGVLEFLKMMPLQIIIAAPPDKIQYISPYAEETLLVMTDEKISYVERYVNGFIR